MVLVTAAASSNLLLKWVTLSVHQVDLPLLDDGAGAYDPAYNLPANELKTDMGLESADPFTPDAGPVDPRLDHSIGRRGIPYLDWPGIKVRCLPK